MKVGERIKKRRIELGMSADDLAEKLGKNRATVYRYESAEIEKLPATVLAKLSTALKVTPAYLMGWNEEDTEDGEAFGLTRIPEMRRIPLLGSIACGEPIFAEENIESYCGCPESIEADFCLRCKGDSMVGARIHDGDIVYIRRQPDVESGEIAAVLIGEEATLKRVYKKGSSVILQPENPAYEPLVFVREEINELQILGKAVYFLSRVK